MVVITNDNNNNIKGLLSGWGLSLTGKPCDSCNAAAALLYCRADTAFLCGSCDANIHVATRHERVWVCEVCEQAPAVLTCKADAAALCSSCDHDIHSANPLARRHERIPITPFLDSPIDAAAARSSAAAASSTFLVPDNTIPGPPSLINNNLVVGNHDDEADTWLIPNPSSTFMYNDSDFLNFSYNNNNNNLVKQPQFTQQDTKPFFVDENENQNRTHGFTDSVVPSQSQGTPNNLSSTSCTESLFDNCYSNNIDFTQPNKHYKKTHFYSSNNNNNSSSFITYSPAPTHSVSSSDIGVVPDGNTNSMSSEVSYTFSKSATPVVDGGLCGGAPAMDREARVLRYREKKKNRKFEKTIRYASRKAYAETRPRVKGRFAKRTENNETSEIDFAVDNVGYGVVPAF